MNSQSGSELLLGSVEDAFSRNGRLLPIGRMAHDTHLIGVKKPEDSKCPWR